MNVPKLSLERLCRIFGYLEELDRQGIKTVTSRSMSFELAITADTIRKDINYIGEMGPSPRGYSVQSLKAMIQNAFDLNRRQGMCIVGLDHIGLALLENRVFFEKTYPILVGFDSNINRIEITNTTIPLYPLHMITDIVRSKRIALAILAVEREYAQESVNRLAQSGIHGIINLSEAFIRSPRNVWIKNFNMIEELRVLAAFIETGVSKAGIQNGTSKLNFDICNYRIENEGVE